MSDLPFRPLGNRVVIVADRDDHAPEATESGVLLAKSLAAAVDGFDAEDSWFTGTVVGVGPLVQQFDVREYVRRRLRETNGQLSDDEFDGLPRNCPDPVHVGDHVCFSWASGQELTVDGEKYLILDAREILAVFDPALEESHA